MISVDKLINDQAALNPDKVAIKHGDRTFTYKQVNEISNRLARYFKDQNINPGDTIGLAIDRSPEMVIAILAIVKAGATYLPVDNNFPIDRVDYMLNDAAIKVLITSKNFRDKYHEHPMLFIEDALSGSAGYDSTYQPSNVNEDSVAYILYTSGSTGKPKGVEVKHLGLTNLLLSVQKAPGMDANDVMLNITTISFDIAELEIYLPLISGALLVITNAEAVKDGRALLEIAEHEKVTIMQGTPFMWRTMLQAGWEKPLKVKIITGGEALPKELAKSLVIKCNSLWNMYGPTETTIYSTIKQISIDDEVITIGVPIDNTEVYILDENLNEVAQGEPGEIYITGDGVGKGYRNKPELTAQKFLDNKFAPGSGGKMYSSGDIGRILANGEIQCLGRIDHQIKIRGYRIETEEVEFQLKQQENVRVALIILFNDVLDNPHLVAYIIPEKPVKKEDTPQFIKTLKSGIGAALPEYMVPDTYMFIDAMPLNSNGKIDRKALPEPVMNQQNSAEYKAPETETEITLTDIFLKKVAIDKIGINDNFFELGINSLIAVSIMVQVEKQFGKRLPLSMLIKYPTIKQLALVVEDDKPDSPYSSLVPIKPQGNKIPLYIIHGIGLNILNLYNLVSNLDPDQPVYGLQAMGLDGKMKLPDSIEAIAQFYNDEITKHNPTGPYAIAGYSFGGYIAYEMVRQLKEMGKEVKLLAMFDTNLQEPTHQYAGMKKYSVKLARQFKKLGFRLSTLFTQPANTFSYLKNEYTVEFMFFLKSLGIAKDYHPENLPEYMQDIADELYSAFHSYKVKPYHVKIDLFKAEKRLYYIDEPKLLGWGKYALDGAQIYNVPGDHKDMFEAENSKIFAKALQTRLNQINT